MVTVCATMSSEKTKGKKRDTLHMHTDQRSKRMNEERTKVTLNHQPPVITITTAIVHHNNWLVRYDKDDGREQRTDENTMCQRAEFSGLRRKCACAWWACNHVVCAQCTQNANMYNGSNVSRYMTQHKWDSVRFRRRCKSRRFSIFFSEVFILLESIPLHLSSSLYFFFVNSFLVANAGCRLSFHEYNSVFIQL